MGRAELNGKGKEMEVKKKDKEKGKEKGKDKGKSIGKNPIKTKGKIKSIIKVKQKHDEIKQKVKLNNIE